MFDTLSDRLESAFTKLRGKGRLSEEDVRSTLSEIRIALLEADVALPVVKAFTTAVRERVTGTEVSASLNPAQQVIKVVNEELVTILGGDTRLLRMAKTAPTVILLAGLQGAGKTTAAGKLGRWLKSKGHEPLLVACDLQRPNAVDQLEVVGRNAGVTVFAPERGASGVHGDGQPIGDPVRVATESIEHARRLGYDVVVVDTAGRLGVDAEMMSQATAIRDAVSPDEVLFVVDAMIGQDAVATALAFQEGVDFTGVVLSKLDGDARGGAALSIAHVCGRPIMFASTGEKLADFDVFHPERMASRILGMGDVLTLIEQAEQAFDADEAERMAAKISSGDDFTLEDFLEQMMAVRKMGPIGNLLKMLPGMGQIREQLESIDDRDLDRVAAIIRSMTPHERQDPKVLNASRRMRIALGSGVPVNEVNQLVDRFFEARKMMKSLSGGLGLGPRRPGKAAKGKGGKKGKKGGGRSPGGPPKLPGNLGMPPGGLPPGGPGALPPGWPGGGGSGGPGGFPGLPPGGPYGPR